MKDIDRDKYINSLITNIGMGEYANAKKDLEIALELKLKDLMWKEFKRQEKQAL